MRRRLGTFLFLVGAVALVLFFTTHAAGYPQIPYFLAGVICISLGVFWIVTGKPESENPPSTRFRLIRQRMSKHDQNGSGGKA